MPDLALRTAVDKDFRPTRGDFLQTILIELSPGRGLRTLPLNLGILLDCSGSMEGPKLENAKRACALILEKLSPEDRATVCVFSSGARAIVPSTTFGPESRGPALNAVAQVRVEGATELLTGMNKVYEEVAPHRSPDVTTFVILLSDGQPTDKQGFVDRDLPKYLDRAKAEFEKNGVSLSTIGLGSAADYDAAFLRDLADQGSGKFLISATPDDLAGVFQEEFGRISSTVLSDVTVEINRLNGKVRRFWRVVPDKKIFDPPQVINNSFRLPVGSLQNDQPQAYLLDVVTTAPASPQSRDLLCQVAAWASASPNARVEANVLTGYSDNDVELAQRNNEVTRLVEEANDFKLQVDLESAVKSGDRRKMTQVLERKKKMTQRLGKVNATKILEDMEDTLSSGGQISADDLAISSQETKKTKRLA
jgi:Ca-activated chloride channel family protein